MVIKVVIADDEDIIRNSLKTILEIDNDIQVIGLAENGIQAVELCDSHMPDLVLMDIRMPVCDGIEGTHIIKSKYPSLKIVVLTTFSDSETVNKAIKNGADGYIMKDISVEELKTVIKNTINGLRILDQNVFNTVTKQLSDASYGINYSEKDEQRAAIMLTEREKSVVRLIVYGKSNKEISYILKISEGRVKNIITNILYKLNLSDRTQLAVFAVKRNLF